MGRTYSAVTKGTGFGSNTSHITGYKELLAYDLIPKAADIGSLIFIAMYFLTMGTWHQDGTLFQTHPMKSLAMIYAAFGVQIVGILYKRWVLQARNTAVITFVQSAVFSLGHYAQKHYLAIAFYIMLTGWVTCVTLKESRHPDFGWFFDEMSFAWFWYYIPAIAVCIIAAGKIAEFVLDLMCRNDAAESAAITKQAHTKSKESKL